MGDASQGVRPPNRGKWSWASNSKFPDKTVFWPITIKLSADFSAYFASA